MPAFPPLPRPSSSSLASPGVSPAATGHPSAPSSGAQTTGAAARAPTTTLCPIHRAPVPRDEWDLPTLSPTHCRTVVHFDIALMTRITIDLRMYRHSGIGRYLRNLMASVRPLLEADAVRVLGSSDLFGDAPWLRDPRIQLFETSAL